LRANKTRRLRTTDSTQRGEIVLLTDSFTTYSEPSIGFAALDLLESAGYQVHLTGSLCCGRSSVSKGLLGDAAQRAQAMVEHLTSFAERDIPIVGLEPSCLLMLKDEYRSLLPTDTRVDAIANSARLLTEFLVGAIDDGAIRLNPHSNLAGRKIVFHGHCHEKALLGTAGSRALLERIPGAEVHELDAGCCGMAGSFGYESEHYELSMRIGALRLFPAIRQADANTVIAASGTSCRQQIEHGTGRRTSHPVELVRQALTIHQ
jgi:Fe-S oxidoreductase